MICPNCGIEIADDSNFCSNCGKAIDKHEVSDTHKSKEVFPDIDDPFIETIKSSKHPRHIKPIIIIAPIILVIIIISTIIICSYADNSSKSDSTSASSATPTHMPTETSGPKILSMHECLRIAEEELIYACREHEANGYIKNFNIATRNYEILDSSDGTFTYKFVFQGTYSKYDSYGAFVDRYKYNYDITIDPYTGKPPYGRPSFGSFSY